MYKDEIIHIAGGLHEYIGKLDKQPHPLGQGWYRVKEPCLIYIHRDEQGRAINILSRLKGEPGKNNYRNYVDIYIPDSTPMEIRTLDKNGEMYKVYQDEMNKKEGLIHLPNNKTTMVN